MFMFFLDVYFLYEISWMDEPVGFCRPFTSYPLVMKSLSRVAATQSEDVDGKDRLCRRRSGFPRSCGWSLQLVLRVGTLQGGMIPWLLMVHNQGWFHG